MFFDDEGRAVGYVRLFLGGVVFPVAQSKQV